MRRLALLLVVTMLAGPSALAGPADRPPYPATRVDDVVETLHGTEVHDPYRWLEDGASPEVQTWAKDQNAFARQQLDRLAGRDKLAKRLHDVSYVDAVSTPQRAGSRLFFTRRKADQEKAVLYWRDETDGVDHALVDPNAASADGSTALGDWVSSYDGKTLAYALRENNADEATLYVKDVATGKVSDRDRIDGAKYATPSWTPAGDAFYYTWLPTDPAIPAAERPGRAEVRYHALGTDPAKDPIIRPASGDPEKFVGPALSRDGRWLLAYEVTFSRADVYFKDLRAPDAGWKTLVAGVPAQFSVEVWKDRFYIRTDDGASRDRLLRADPSAADPADRKQWEEIVPEAADAVLEGMAVVGGRLALTYLRNAASELEIRTLDGKPIRTVKLPGIGSSGGLVGTADGDEAFYNYSSFTDPPEIWRTSVATGETKLWSRREVPVDPKPYAVEQVLYPSKDGTKVPMFLVHRKDAKRDGSTPFMLTGYGGFGINMEPSFSGRLYPWLEAGGGYALANLRGGGEYGEDWHKAGSLGNKQNVFDDFIAAGEYLVKEGWTKPERLAIQGGSNGGLLMGAALTQRPDLFKAVICEVPLLDMVRYHRFGSGRTWVSEYGSADNKDDFGWLYAYSPYHHVKSGTPYPAVLMASSDSDDRVDPLHARKMTAALQAASTGAGPILLRIEAHAGHGGADLVSAAVAKAVDVYAFLFDQLRISPPS
ncbi:MAG TPA: prolyl oligopeptidase family serine peptidase [Acidimicrobiia bacterium]|nr:prolyl oligopeptidase family serine peptidase [Acidimicrobiia bacterium]